MLDSMSAHREPTNQQIEQYKEFTFGKDEVEYTLYDKIKEESLKNMENMEKGMNIDADLSNINPTLCEQPDNIASVDPAQS
jgi:uncharacterized phage-like protein YoqJ